MRKLKLFFACLLMAVLSIGQVWADDEVVYTLTPATGSDNGYASAEDIDITDGETTITWNVTGNSTMTPWRIGGKSLNNVERVVYSKTAMSDAITKVELEVGAASSITVNSLKMVVASDAAFNTVIDEVSKTFAANSKITFSPTSPATEWDADAYYKFVFKVSVTGTSNKYVEFKKAYFYAEAAAPAYTITAQSNDESKGTVSLTGSVITGSPKSGCRYASPAYTVTSGTATVAQSGNAFTVTPSSDCTVRINFEAIPQYTVTWDNNGSTSTSQVLEGNKPVFPATPASCDATSTTFVGWATAPWTGKLANLDDKTVYTKAADMPDVDAAVTYYAVFAKSSGSAGNLFEWEGGTSSELTALENVTASGLGSDYAAGNAPYRVKFDTDDDYIVITTSGAIESVAVGVKMIGGGNTSHIYVQEAEDAESDFSAVETLTISGAQNDVLNLETENAFNADSRAVKLLFNKGSNVGVGPITIAGAASASDYMTTCAAPTCADLGTPVVSVTNKTYNSAKLTWAAVANADKYLVKFNGVDQEATENLYFDATGLTPATQYTYQVKALAEEGQDDYCDGAFSAEANFTTEAAPTAHLTLMNLGVEHAESADHAILTPFNLPSTAAACSKAFVGWDADENCATAPTYAKGAEFTFSNTTDVTLYAVYADVTGGGASSVEFNAETYAGANGWEDATAYTTFTINGVTFTATGGANDGKYYNSDKTWRLYNGGSLSISATGVTISSVSSNPSVSFAEDNGIFSCSFTATTKFKSITVNVAAPETYENYSTECAAPLADPTFSLDPVVAPVNDKYEEAINVVITNNAGEGTIYYTLDDTDPTSSSTRKEYTGTAITLNACGSTTIKAIAISTTNHSSIASATYEIAIPVPTNSQLAPYSPTEAREVIDGGCYDGTTIMYVKGVVKTCSAWNSTYGNYDVVVRNIGNEESETFTYFRMYAASGNTKFTSDENIEVGDTILAAGVLTLYGSTYEFAQNTCYMVEHKKMVAPKTSIANDEATAYTVEQAKAFCNAPTTYDLTDEVYVKGVAYGAPNNQGTFNIHDASSDNTFQIYKGTLSAALEALSVEIEENDTIVAKGTIQYYNSTTYQMNAGGEVVTVKKYVAPVVAVTGVEVDATATVKAGKTVQLTATVLPDNASNKNVTWTVESGDAYAEVSATGLVTGKAEGTAVIRATSVADDTKYGECTVTVNPGTPANTDILTAEEIGVSGSYANWSGKNTFGTTSVYAGNSTTGTGTNAGAIQLRSHATDEAKQAGIVLTGSNGLYLKNFAVTVKSGSNTLNVYAKNTAYTSRLDLYSDDEDVRGILIGTVSSTGSITLEDGISYNDNYQYIGMRSAGGALYLEDITITWGAAYVPPTVYTVTFDSNGGSAVDAADVNEGDAVAKPADPTREGYTFNYWTLNEVEYDFDTPVTDNITLVANWTEDTPAPVYTEVRSGLEPGRYYTVCLPREVVAVKGATFWTLEKKNMEGSQAYLEEETNNLPFAAGKPFIIQATANKLEVAYEGDATEVAGTNGALHGTLVYMDAAALAAAGPGVYMLFSNELRPVGENNHLDANRAYVLLSELNAVPEAPQNAPGRRVVAMPMEKDVTTDINALNAAEAPVKMIIDGNLFILRGEKLYDATGRLVK